MPHILVLFFLFTKHQFVIRIAEGGTPGYRDPGFEAVWYS